MSHGTSRARAVAAATMIALAPLLIGCHANGPAATNLGAQATLTLDQPTTASFAQPDDQIRSSGLVDKHDSTGIALLDIPVTQGNRVFIDIPNGTFDDFEVHLPDGTIQHPKAAPNAEGVLEAYFEAKQTETLRLVVFGRAGANFTVSAYSNP
jgi:hypothetical protein